jgi:hypothetical protein
MIMRMILNVNSDGDGGGLHELPGAQLDLGRMPGHWLLARMGKRVLRPGGLELTMKMLDGLAISATDDVVEFAPGLGTTTRLVLTREPATYLAVERDEAAARATRRVLRPGRDRCLQGLASRTGVDDASATVVFGEAMLTMQTAAQKSAIIQEAHRVLRRGGRYGMHELALVPDSIPETDKAEIQRALSEVIRVGARPLTVAEWERTLVANGFELCATVTTPMHLLEPARVVADEGLLGALRITANVMRSPAALRRVLAMRAVFRKHAAQLCAVALVARKLD